MEFCDICQRWVNGQYYDYHLSHCILRQNVLNSYRSHYANMPIETMVQFYIGPFATHAATMGEYETNIQLAEQIGRVMIGVSNINEALPKVGHADLPVDDRCPVCWDAFSDVLEARVTPCGHFFCDPCACQWFSDHKQCPICNADVQDLVDESKTMHGDQAKCEGRDDVTDGARDGATDEIVQGMARDPVFQEGIRDEQESDPPPAPTTIWRTSLSSLPDLESTSSWSTYSQSIHSSAPSTPRAPLHLPEEGMDAT